MIGSVSSLRGRTPHADSPLLPADAASSARERSEPSTGAPGVGRLIGLDLARGLILAFYGLFFLLVLPLYRLGAKPLALIAGGWAMVGAFMEAEAEDEDDRPGTQGTSVPPAKPMCPQRSPCALNVPWPPHGPSRHMKRAGSENPARTR